MEPERLEGFLKVSLVNPHQVFPVPSRDHDFFISCTAMRTDSAEDVVPHATRVSSSEVVQGYECEKGSGRRSDGTSTSEDGTTASSTSCIAEESAIDRCMSTERIPCADGGVAGTRRVMREA